MESPEEKIAYIEFKPKDDGSVTAILYNNIIDKKEVSTIDIQNFNIDDYLDKISTYKYTFKSAGNENYYFDRIELVK